MIDPWSMRPYMRWSLTTIFSTMVLYLRFLLLPKDSKHASASGSLHLPFPLPTDIFLKRFKRLAYWFNQTSVQMIRSSLTTISKTNFYVTLFAIIFFLRVSQNNMIIYIYFLVCLLSASSLVCKVHENENWYVPYRTIRILSIRIRHKVDVP